MSEIQDDEEDEVLDFVFDGTIRYAVSYASSGREFIVELRDIVEAFLVGQGSPEALDRATATLMNKVDAAQSYYAGRMRNSPALAEFCARNIATYQRARDALEYMRRYLSDPVMENITRGMTNLELAVADVDKLVEEDQSRGGR